jgi:hypothetical protein
VCIVITGANLGFICDCGSVAGQGDALLTLFYPDHDTFWLGLLPGVPAVFTFLLSGRRHLLPRLWRLMRLLLILAQAALLLWQPLLWLYGEAITGVGLGLSWLISLRWCGC